MCKIEIIWSFKVTYDRIDRESERQPKIIPQFSTAKLHPLLRKGSWGFGPSTCTPKSKHRKSTQTFKLLKYFDYFPAQCGIIEKGSMWTRPITMFGTCSHLLHMSCTNFAWFFQPEQCIGKINCEVSLLCQCTQACGGSTWNTVLCACLGGALAKTEVQSPGFGNIFAVMDASDVYECILAVNTSIWLLIPIKTIVLDWRWWNSVTSHNTSRVISKLLPEIRMVNVNFCINLKNIKSVDTIELCHAS